MKIPMPSPRGTNHEGLFIRYSGGHVMAYDSAITDDPRDLNTLTPEQALKQLRDEDESFLQTTGSVPPDEEPRLAKYRSRMSPADFKAFCRMVQDVRFGFRSSAQDRVRLSRLHAHDHASAESSFKQMFPDASLPETIFY